MKTPEESKCGLECIRTNKERICVKPENGQCPRCEQLVEESLVRIHQLETSYSQVSKALCGKENATTEEFLQAVDQLKSRLAQVERERDAAVHDLKLVRCCGTCVNNEGGCTTECYIVSGVPSGWQWRGVCAENTEEDSP